MCIVFCLQASPDRGARVHAECNCVLHSARPHVLHSAGGPYITSIAKQMDEGFAGIDRGFDFLTPLSVSFVPAYPL
jgi:hypothetical protein